MKAIRTAKKASDPKFRSSDFAVTCLLSLPHLSNIEAGRRFPPEDVIHRIAAHLGVPVDAISYVKDIEVAA